jgi:elongation factor 2
VIDLAMEDKKDKLFDMLKKINVYDKLKSEDRELVGKPLMKRVMQVRGIAASALAVYAGNSCCKWHTASHHRL